MIATAFAACLGFPAVFAPAAREAARIAAHGWLLIGVCTAVYVVVIAVFVAALLRRRGEIEPPDSRERGKVVAVAAGAAITVVILFVFLVSSERVGNAIEGPPGENPLQIMVTGHQWWWEVRYPASPPSNEVATANEIHVPVGRRVVIQLTSGDVIHSFWAPAIDGKRDAIPGRKTTLAFRVDRPGVFHGRCAEFCGYQHAHMGFLLIAHPPAEFEAWLAHQRLPAAEPTADATVRGREVFLTGTCVLCHSIRGTGAFGRNAPDLTHVASRRTLAATTLPNGPGSLGGWIADPQGVKPGNHMPANPMKGSDLLALISYLGSLK
jgi:cytochrome c oxidase subunit II